MGHELLHFLNSHKNGQQGYVALKLDMSKAYDRVEWSFISYVMEKLGFPCEWIDLVNECISTASFSILINGEAIGNFSPSRGLRQGDPLSPYLFLLCMKGLSSMLCHARSNCITGIAMSPSSPKISHLFFADDSLIFLKASAEEFGYFKVIMADYERASGQCINLEKSQICFSKNVPSDTQYCLSSLLQMKSVDHLGSYLGLP